MNQNRNKNLLR